MTSPTAPTVSATGITAPTFSAILTYLQAQYQAIYGADVYLGADSQDGQFLGIIAAAINDSNAAAVAVYNSFSPATAQGNGLSSAVKINGIARSIGTNSTVDVAIGGTPGTVINGGRVADALGNNWSLPATVIIPSGGSISVTATAVSSGAVPAAIGAVNVIQTPVYGWSSVTNMSAASLGSITESDAALRVRQQWAVSIPSQTVLAGIVGAVNEIAGVVELAAYENDTGATDSNGLPAHSIALVVNGGDQTAIAAAISNQKTPGAYTHGTTAVSVVDSIGIPHTIRFFRPTSVPVSVAITLHALTGYSTAIAAKIQAALVAYVSGLSIGQSVMISRLYVPAQLNGSVDALSFEVVTLLAAIKPAANGSADLPIAFNAMATLALTDVTITVV